MEAGDVEVAVLSDRFKVMYSFLIALSPFLLTVHLLTNQVAFVKENSFSMTGEIMVKTVFIIGGLE